MAGIRSFAALALIGAAGIFQSAEAQPLNELRLYVSASGNDANSGLQLRSAVRTLERARDLARGARGNRTILLAGTFSLRQPLRLDARDSRTSWRSLPGGQAALVNDGEAAAAIVMKNTGGLSIEGITFRGFLNDGLLAFNAKHVTVANNIFEDTGSQKWAQAAIHFMLDAANVRVIGNQVRGALYDGILFDTNAQSTIDNILIAGNVITDSCRAVEDCGAIHVNDRGRRGKGVQIRDNVVVRFGEAPGTRGIYLDDWASGVTVAGNRVFGPGTYGAQIHGGSDNLIAGNTFDLRTIRWGLLVHSHVSGAKDAMTGNVLSGNRFIGGDRGKLQLSRGLSGDRFPAWQGNMLCRDASPESCEPLDEAGRDGDRLGSAEGDILARLWNKIAWTISRWFGLEGAG